MDFQRILEDVKGIRKKYPGNQIRKEESTHHKDKKTRKESASHLEKELQKSLENSTKNFTKTMSKMNQNKN